MERAFPIYGMAEGADPDALPRSWLLAEPLAPVYAAQRARRAVDAKKIVCEPDEVLWSPRMRPDDGIH
jgi:dethiobiotin synthetase